MTELTIEQKQVILQRLREYLSDEDYLKIVTGDYLNKCKLVNYYDGSFNSLEIHRILSYSFHWGSSNEKHDYWSKVYDNLQRDVNYYKK